MDGNSLSLSKGIMSVITLPTPRLHLSSPNRAENREMVLFGAAVTNLAQFLPQAWQVALALTPEEMVHNRDRIYDQILSCYTAKNVQMRNVLTVSCYNGAVSIWIRRNFFETESQVWLACKGGFQIQASGDNPEEVAKFLKTHMNTLRPKQQQANKENVPL